MQRTLLVGAVVTGAIALSRENFQYGGLEDSTVNQELPKINELPAILDCDFDKLELSRSVIAKDEGVPTAYRCIAAITVAYMVVFASLASNRTYHEVKGTPRGIVEAALKAAFQTMTYGPMVCVLFLAYQMRVDFLSDGKGQSQIWAQHCMLGATIAVFGSALLAFVVPIFFGKPMTLIPGTFVIVTPRPAATLRLMSSILRYLVLLALYGGLVGVALGIWLQTPSVSGPVKETKPAPAIMCTIIVTGIFFLTQVVIAACRTHTEFKGHETAFFVGVTNAASSIAEFGPMLCGLFLAARMQALQHSGGRPEAWAEFCMFVATCTLGLASLLAVFVPIVLSGVVRINHRTSEAKFEVPNRLFGLTLLACRYVALLCFHCGTAGVALSMFFVGPQRMLPVSPAIQCVMNLAVQFFVIYFIVMVVITTFELSEGYLPMESCMCFASLEAAKGTVQMAPMLAVLFLAIRMYALQITEEKGAPQRWVQDAMYLATWSLLASIVACLATGITMGKVEQDDRGDITNRVRVMCLAVPILLIRYICMLLLYGSIVATIFGLFAMLPSTANGEASNADLLPSAKLTKYFLFKQQA